MIGEIIVIILLWSLIGFVCFGLVFTGTRVDDGTLDWLSPIWIYENFEVNYFGAFLLTVFFNLLCPVLTIGYWFCKLCAVGRR